MMTTAAVRDLLAAHGAVKSQPAEDWRGDFALPQTLLEFYRDVGPSGRYINDTVGFSGCTIPAPGNPIWLPPLSRLWQLQAGYRWHGLTGERLEGWSDGWLVIASQGGDPFIFNQSDQTILFDYHGTGAWNPTLLYPDIYTMTACVATAGSVINETEDDLYTPDDTLNPKVLAQLEQRLLVLFGDQTQAKRSGVVRNALHCAR